MRKKTVVILLTALLFIAIAVLGVSTVFRVRSAKVDAEVISQAATEEVEELQKRLQAAYDKDSTFRVNDKKAKEILEDFPYFRMTGFSKSYPDKIVVKVTEDAEVFAMEKADSEDYYILGADGMILAIRPSTENRLDSSPNVIVSGEGLNVSGDKGEKINGGDNVNAMLDVCALMAEELNGLRDNVVSIQVAKYAPEFCIVMREGVKIYIGEPAVMTREKAAAAIEKYLSLTDAQRMKGRIAVAANGEEIRVDYSEIDFDV